MVINDDTIVGVLDSFVASIAASFRAVSTTTEESSDVIIITTGLADGVAEGDNDDKVMYVVSASILLSPCKYCYIDSRTSVIIVGDISWSKSSYCDWKRQRWDKRNILGGIVVDPDENIPTTTIILHLADFVALAFYNMTTELSLIALIKS